MKTILKKLDSLKATQKRIAELDEALDDWGYDRETRTFDYERSNAWLANYEESKKQHRLLKRKAKDLAAACGLEIKTTDSYDLKRAIECLEWRINAALHALTDVDFWEGQYIKKQES